MSCVISIPDWPCFNKNTPKWLTALPAEWTTRETYTEKYLAKLKEKEQKTKNKKEKSTSQRSAAAEKVESLRNVTE